MEEEEPKESKSIDISILAPYEALELEKRNRRKVSDYNMDENAMNVVLKKRTNTNCLKTEEYNENIFLIFNNYELTQFKEKNLEIPVYK